MKLNRMTRRQLKKMAKKDPAVLLNVKAMIWIDDLDHGYEAIGFLLNQEEEVLLSLVRPSFLDEDFIEVAPSKYWKKGILNSPRTVGHLRRIQKWRVPGEKFFFNYWEEGNLYPDGQE